PVGYHLVACVSDGLRPCLRRFHTRRSSDLALRSATRSPLTPRLRKVALISGTRAWHQPATIKAYPVPKLPGSSRFRPASVILSPDRKSTRLNSHVKISYAVFCLKKKNKR